MDLRKNLDGQKAKRTEAPDAEATQKGEQILKFLASLMMRGFYGTVTIPFEDGKTTHVETETRRVCEYKDLPEETTPPADTAPNRSA